MRKNSHFRDSWFKWCCHQVNSTMPFILYESQMWCSIFLRSFHFIHKMTYRAFACDGKSKWCCTKQNRCNNFIAFSITFNINLSLHILCILWGFFQLFFYCVNQKMFYSFNLQSISAAVIIIYESWLKFYFSAMETDYSINF